MFATKCPGQDMRYWTADDVSEEKCPQCGEMIEFFKTDIRLRCRNCKTRVANPQFDMGCAQWCAHAEMCLGPGVKGLQNKSYKDILVEEFEQLSGGWTESVALVKDIIGQAENKCRRDNVDMLQVVASIVIVALVKLNIITDADAFLQELKQKHSFPPEALKEIRMIVEIILEGKLPESGKKEPEKEIMANIINEVFNEQDKEFTDLHQ